MILEFLAGIIVAISAGLFFVGIKFVNSANAWIIETSKFIYFSGHPVLDDDEIYSLITKKFRGVFSSFLIIIIKIFIFIVGALVIVALSSIALDFVTTGEAIDFSSSGLAAKLFPDHLYGWPFILGTLVPIILFPILQKKKTTNPDDPYTPLEKFMHYVFLGNANISKILFKLELRKNKRYLASIDTKQNVYVSGLARAGTTVLMQYLAQIPQFKSLSYRNMPFIFLPKTWLKHSSKKAAVETERFHKDGIKHSVDTQEALEEPFWRNFIGSSFIKENVITVHSIDDATYDKYRSFRKLVAGDSIYLAKNNNHLLRADSLHNYDKAAGEKTITIIPFRHPYTQAKSLLTQHKNLSDLQNRNEFALDYMDFLVHHEFGIHHKIAVFKNSEGNNLVEGNERTIEYWMDVWYSFYKEVLEYFSNKDGFYFFSYEKFVEDPTLSLTKIISLLDIPENQINSIEIKNFTPRKSDDSVDVKEEHLKLYNELTEKAVNNEI